VFSLSEAAIPYLKGDLTYLINYTSIAVESLVETSGARNLWNIPKLVFMPIRNKGHMATDLAE